MARDPDHDRIAGKAHELWEAAGKPHGQDQKHWDEAREIIAIRDSQGDTLLPRDAGAQEPIEDATAALRNEGEFPGLTDQGENLLTSTDREPDLVATPSGRKGRMPKAEVPTSDQPGVPAKGRKGAAAKGAEAAQPKTADVPPKGVPDMATPTKAAAKAPAKEPDRKPAGSPKGAAPMKAGKTKKPA